MILSEKYRPKVFSEVIGQPKAVNTLERLRKSPGFAGTAFAFIGPTGTGKTTLARIVASEVADPLFVTEMDADALTTERLREIESESRYYGWGSRPGRAYIVNECHGLRAQIIRRLLVLLEQIPSHVVWLFTTSHDGSDKLFEDQIDAAPFLNRCHVIAVTSQGVNKPFAERCRTIAKAEGLDGAEPAAYERLIKDSKSSLREALARIERGCMAAE